MVNYYQYSKELEREYASLKAYSQLKGLKGDPMKIHRITDVSARIEGNIRMLKQCILAGKDSEIPSLLSMILEDLEDFKILLDLKIIKEV
jgi:hypothetical protein